MYESGIVGSRAHFSTLGAWGWKDKIRNLYLEVEEQDSSIMVLNTIIY